MSHSGSQLFFDQIRDTKNSTDGFFTVLLLMMRYSGLFKCVRNLMEPSGNLNMLRAFTFTLQTADTGACQSAVLCGIGIASLRIFTVAEQHISVHDLKEIGNVDLHRAAGSGIIECRY